MNPPKYPQPAYRPPMPSDPRAVRQWKRARSSGKRKIIIAVVVVAILIGGAFVAHRMLVAVEVANRILCASHMNQIGKALQQYASFNNGRLPPSLAALGQAAISGLLTCPSGKSPLTFAAANLDLSSLLPDARRKIVLLYEPLTNHTDGINILWGDGQVTWEAAGWGREVIEEIIAGHNPPQVLGLTTPSTLGPPAR